MRIKARAVHRCVDPGGWGVRTPWKYVGGSEYVLTPPKNVTFFPSKLLLYYYKFHSIKDEQLDTITSLILLMLMMLPSLCLISSKQTLSSNQCLCCCIGLKVTVAQAKTLKRGWRWPAVDNPHRSRLTHCPSHEWPSTARVAHQGRVSWGWGGSDPWDYAGRVRVCFAP